MIHPTIIKINAVIKYFIGTQQTLKLELSVLELKGMGWKVLSNARLIFKPNLLAVTIGNSKTKFWVVYCM